MKPAPQRGFTLVELVVAMLLMAVLATVASQRFADRGPFAAQAIADQLTSGLRLAQAAALARRQTVHVLLAASPPTLSVCLDAACTQPLPSPGGGTWLDPMDDVSLGSAAAFSFDAAGTPSFASALSISVTANDPSLTRSLRIEAGSGHVHAP